MPYQAWKLKRARKAINMNKYSLRLKTIYIVVTVIMKWSVIR
jgi:hypothetical protein